MGKLDGRVALITGGASGLGEATVRLFAAEGAKILICDVQDDRGGALADALGGSAEFCHADVTQEADIAGAVEHARGAFGRLDILFNNAGLPGVAGNIADIDVAGYDHTMAVLLRGVFLGMKYGAAAMQRQGSGNIISTASVAGLTTAFSTPHIYNAAKAAVVQLTKSVALELAEHNIRVNAICPGFIATPIFAAGSRLPDEVKAQVPELVQPILAERQPLRRAGLPEDIARAALWLASDDASFVTGHALVVDGGISSGQHWEPEKMGGVPQLREALRERR